MDDVPPVTLASWRLQFTTFLLAIGFYYQWTKVLTPEQRTTFHTHRTQLWLSGICLALHFGFWVWGIFNTSLAHSLLFVSATPIVLVGWHKYRGMEVSRNELIATALAVLGAVLLMIDAKSDREATVWGDFICFLGAAAMAGYLEIGQALRKHMPIYIYSTPVTGIAALVLCAGGIILEGAGIIVSPNRSLFGYFANGTYFGKVRKLTRNCTLAPLLHTLSHTGLTTLDHFWIPPTRRFCTLQWDQVSWATPA